MPTEVYIRNKKINATKEFDCTVTLAVSVSARSLSRPWGVNLKYNILSLRHLTTALLPLKKKKKPGYTTIYQLTLDKPSNGRASGSIAKD